VHAQGGRRDEYLAIEQVAGEPIRSGDALALARQYRERFGLMRLYVADLDAIEGRMPQAILVRNLASSGVSIWLDAGVASVDAAFHALDLGVEKVIVGLETLTSFDVLDAICRPAGERVVFSLDLQDGMPLAHAPELGQQQPDDLIARAVAAGASAVIVLDLARVGSGAGLDLELLMRTRASAPAVPLYVGGGVRHADDLELLKRAGARGALVASALLDGRLTPDDVLAT
jgi:phosphoribosylformimino-5-aminoimidazole carboxamide ribotide isomerase